MTRRRTRGPVAPLLATAAAASYTVNAAFGVAVATGAIDNTRIRWMHHALFIATASLTASAVVAGAIERHAGGQALTPVVAVLAALPFTGGGLRRHAAVAALAAPAFAIALVLSWRRH